MGKALNRLKTISGEIELTTPQDRKCTFEPQIDRKGENTLADSLAPHIIALYSRGMSIRGNSDHIMEMFDFNVSRTTLSEFAERIIPLVKDRTAAAVA
ncbi:mutator family transposase [Dyadobacter jejuensis]|uniref:Mutator family transposase n=1 Tax=Dyadobacter jejuensis TaxID=1082580 RepID=A0A316ATP0_9BACT|nr:transposase [Dyadobacter jejuensis]PWJ60684.1 mutator family transposase [Dyadobacter jejuensis]